MKLNDSIITKVHTFLKSEDFLKSIKPRLNENESTFKLFIDDGIDFDQSLVKEFINFCLEYLKISDKSENLKVVLSTDKEKFTTYAFYDINNKIAAVYCPNRAILDCLRSLAHELVHFKQDIMDEIPKEQVSGDNDGVPIEDEANAVAGVIMRKFGRNHKELY